MLPRSPSRSRMATVQPSQPWFKANWRLPRREQNVRICAPAVRPGRIYETAPNAGYFAVSPSKAEDRA